jgi:hypothetical protein
MIGKEVDILFQRLHLNEIVLFLIKKHININFFKLNLR